MSYKFVEGVAIADVTFEATGKTLEELFESAGKALTNSMVSDLDTVENKTSMKFSLKNVDEERLLHDFLQEIIYYKDAEVLLFNDYKLKITKEEDGFGLEAILGGEKIDPKKHELIIDVKAVSWHMYKVEKNDEWEAFVILDV
jgi:SHS2 domain-containing protein